MNIVLISVNHAKAPLEALEKLTLSLTPKGFLSRCKKYRPEELAIISTCNRVELLFATKDKKNTVPSALEVWADITGTTVEYIKKNAIVKQGQNAAYECFLTTAGLSSLVVGEPQIAGQVKSAYKAAVADGTTKTFLNKLFHRSFYVSKKIRSTTKVSGGFASVPHAAAVLLWQNMQELEKKKALILGTGEMALLMAQHLKKLNIGCFAVAGRTLASAAAFAKKTGASSAATLKDLPTILKNGYDIIVAATSAPEYQIYEHDLKACESFLPEHLICLDLAMPRNIDPGVASLSGVELYDIAKIGETGADGKPEKPEKSKTGEKVATTTEVNACELEKAREIARKEADAFARWMKSLALNPTIVDFFNKTQNIATQEMNKTLRRLGSADEQTKEAIKDMLFAVVKKINHDPITFIKKVEKHHAGSGQKYANILRSFFNLNAESEHE